MEKARPKSPLLTRIVMGFVLAAFYLPIVIVVVESFLKHTESESGLTLEWYRSVFDDEKIGSALFRSLTVGLASSLLATFLGTCAALVLYKISFRARRWLEMMSNASLTLPELVFALSLLSWFSFFSLELGLHTVIISHVTFSIPFVLMTVGARVKTLDSRLDDAAKDLGASEWRTLWQITIPLLKPSMIAGFILALLISFDDFLITFYTNGPARDTLPIVLYSQMKYGLSPKLHALASLMLFFSLLLIGMLLRFAPKQGVSKADNKH